MWALQKTRFPNKNWGFDKLEFAPYLRNVLACCFEDP